MHGAPRCSDTLLLRFRFPDDLFRFHLKSNRYSPVDDLNRDIGAMKLLPSMQAALGAKWAHYVNTRAFLLHTGGRGVLHLAKSPFAPETRCALL